MRRRTLITLLGGAAAAPLAARAQQMPVIGFLSGRPAGESRYLFAAFLNGLREQGFNQSQNVAIESEWADGQFGRLPELAADLVRRRVTLIAAVGAVEAIQAAKTATSTIPIVFVTGDDPVRLGLVASINRPGGNITGVSAVAQQLEEKRVAILHELVPKTATIAIIVNPNAQSAELQSKQAEAAAHALSRQLDVLMTATPADIDQAFATLARRGTGGLIVSGDPFLVLRREQLAALAARYRIPTLYSIREAAQAGGLMSYGASIPDAYRQVGVYAGRILKGEKPGDLPVMQAAKFDFVINLKTAKALGFHIPDKLMALADEVIE